MTSQEAFTPEEWTNIMEGPTSAAMAVITASRGGTFRETLAEAKFFAEARRHHGASELLDAIVSHKPVSDRPGRIQRRSSSRGRSSTWSKLSRSSTRRRRPRNSLTTGPS